ncbi:iron-hydroxamate transporter permease subunit [Salmonella enterica subsp. enterica]|uniref:Iron-hydroxamate transporter permease subunit n=1 Tax=Salmonella enterica I TaxID=59201 RepID=A0A379X0C2_SALET|nr:iron-hydroxamate transporter permease subunit [Salmonella enterica subsp. enterica]
MTIGPLSFVGTDGAAYCADARFSPDDAAYGHLGAGRGAFYLVFADWCGRMALFPYQIPAGLLSSFIGAPYFIYLLRKQSR